MDDSKRDKIKVQSVHVLLSPSSHGKKSRRWDSQISLVQWTTDCCGNTKCTNQSYEQSARVVLTFRAVAPPIGSMVKNCGTHYYEHQG